MASKVYLLPINQLNFDDLRKMFKQAKADARGSDGKDMHKVSKDETPK